jgi:hypothetical protein
VYVGTFLKLLSQGRPRDKFLDVYIYDRQHTVKDFIIMLTSSAPSIQRCSATQNMENVALTLDLLRCSIGEENCDAGHATDSYANEQCSFPPPEKFLFRRAQLRQQEICAHQEEDLSFSTGTAGNLCTTARICSKSDFIRATRTTMALNEPASWKCSTEERRQAASAVASLFVAYKAQEK